MVSLPLLFALLLAFSVGCEDAANNEPDGTVRGTVTIGPLSPVSRVGVPDPTPRPEVFSARKIVVYESDGETLIVQVDIGPTGKYDLSLPPGEYVIDINRNGVDFADGFPRSITVPSDQVTIVDVSIDTGIR
jgi:hypothetical protein